MIPSHSTLLLPFLQSGVRFHKKRLKTVAELDGICRASENTHDGLERGPVNRPDRLFPVQSFLDDIGICLLSD